MFRIFCRYFSTNGSNLSLLQSDGIFEFQAKASKWENIFKERDVGVWFRLHLLYKSDYIGHGFYILNSNSSNSFHGNILLHHEVPYWFSFVAEYLQKWNWEFWKINLERHSQSTTVLIALSVCSVLENSLWRYIFGCYCPCDFHIYFNCVSDQQQSNGYEH